MEVDSVVVVGLSASMGAVAALYHTILRPGTQDLLGTPLPHDDGAARALGGQLRSARRVLTVVISLHIVFLALFLLASAEAVGSIGSGGSLDPTRVAAVALTGLGLVHLWVLLGDWRALSGLLTLGRRPPGPASTGGPP